MANSGSSPGAGGRFAAATRLVTLLVPIGAESAPISHGTTQYPAYRADHSDPDSRWLVDVPATVAIHLMHNGGFAMKKQEATLPPAEHRVIVHHPADPDASCGGERQADGNWLVPVAMAAELAAHGWVGGPRDSRDVGSGHHGARKLELAEQAAAPAEHRDSSWPLAI